MVFLWRASFWSVNFVRIIHWRVFFWLLFSSGLCVPDVGLDRKLLHVGCLIILMVLYMLYCSFIARIFPYSIKLSSVDIAILLFCFYLYVGILRRFYVLLCRYLVCWGMYVTPC